MQLFLHEGKRQVAVNDLNLLGELAAAADVLVCEAATADQLLNYGFDDWTTPVKVALTPFGRSGPKRNWRGTPNVILAMGGYTYLMGDPDKAPLNLPGHYVEFQTGALAYASANACRFAGEANSVDLSMLETLMALSQFTTVRWHCAGDIRTRHGSDFWFVVPSDLFACADGWVYLNIVPTFWDPLTVFLDRPELLIDDRFISNDLRMQHRNALHAIVAAVLAPLSKAEITERAEQCRIPLGVVMGFDEVLADPHLAARRFFVEATDAEGHTWLCPDIPFSFDRREPLSRDREASIGG
jgi:crotonobetainyl-CoA:carnitine CoA-transferase CaiB-like acyl-CoA transferase